MVDKDDSFDNLLSDIKDNLEFEFELDDRDYFLYDRGRFMSNEIQSGSEKNSTPKDIYETDIHSLSTQIFQIFTFGRIIYENTKGKVINWSEKLQKTIPSRQDRVLKEHLDEELGMIGTIFLKYSYDTLPIKQRMENLHNFRKLVREHLIGNGYDVLDYPQLKQDKLKSDLDNDGDKDRRIDTLNQYVDNSNYDIENYLKKIGFSQLQMLEFFKEILDDDERINS
jgi:hypothetical protein